MYDSPGNLSARDAKKTDFSELGIERVEEPPNEEIVQKMESLNISAPPTHDIFELFCMKSPPKELTEKWKKYNSLILMAFHENNEDDVIARCEAGDLHFQMIHTEEKGKVGTLGNIRFIQNSWHSYADYYYENLQSGFQDIMDRLKPILDEKCRLQVAFWRPDIRDLYFAGLSQCTTVHVPRQTISQGT